MEESKGKDPDLGESESDVRTDRGHGREQRSLEAKGGNPDLGPSESDVRTDQSHERDPSSREARREILQKNGSACKFSGDAFRLPMRQATNVKNLIEFFHRKERDGAKPLRQKIIPDPRDHDPRRHGEDWVYDIEKQASENGKKNSSQILDGILAGYKQARMEKEQRQRENTEGQRREAQANVQEHKQRDTVWRKFEKKKREAQENAQEQRLMGIPVKHNVAAHDQQNHNVDAHGQDNLQEQRQREKIEWQTREAQEAVQEHTQRDIEKERREAEESLEEQRLKGREAAQPQENEVLEYQEHIDQGNIDEYLIPIIQIPAASGSISVAIYILASAIISISLYWFFGDQYTGKKTKGFVDSLYLFIVTFSTVGYGDIVPKTVFAKILSSVVVINNFICLEIFVSCVVKPLLQLQERCIKAIIKTEINQKMKVISAFCCLFLCFLIGFFFLHFQEKLSWVDSFYMSVVTITTVGYGDQHFETLGGRIFASFWILANIVAMSCLVVRCWEWKQEPTHNVDQIRESLPRVT